MSIVRLKPAFTIMTDINNSIIALKLFVDRFTEHSN